MKLNHLLLCFLILSIFNVCDSGTCIDASKNYDRLGNKLYSIGNYSEAMDYFNKSIDQNSSYIDAWIHKGNAQKALRYYNSSRQSYNRAIALDSKNEEALSGLVDSYSASKDYSSASAMASVLTGINPTNKGYWLKSGTLLQIRGDFEGAQEDFDRALSLDGMYREALYRKALSELAVNNTNRAIELLELVVEIDAKYKQAYNLQGLALEAQGRYEAAITAYDTALMIDPKWTPAMRNKMHAEIAAGNQKEAADILLRM